MPLKFDATLKDLVQAYAADWLAVLDEPPSGPVEVLTPDLSTLTAFSDIVLRIGDWLLHLDFQSGPDPDLPRRILLYNALLHERYGLPVHSVVILLRPRADRGDLTGTVNYAVRPERGRLDFVFEVVRLLASGLGTLPLAPLGQMPEGRALDEALPQVIAHLVQRIETEAEAEQERLLLTASYVLMGLRLSAERAIELFQGVGKMRDSTTYQAILEEGRVEGLTKGRAEGRTEGLSMGRMEEARQLLLRLGRKRFGQPDATVEATVQAIDDLERLESLIERVIEVASWQELLQTP